MTDKTDDFAGILRQSDSILTNFDGDKAGGAGLAAID
jgi:hypothetical protein